MVAVGEEGEGWKSKGDDSRSCCDTFVDDTGTVTRRSGVTAGEGI